MNEEEKNTYSSKFAPRLRGDNWQAPGLLLMLELGRRLDRLAALPNDGAGPAGAEAAKTRGECQLAIQDAESQLAEFLYTEGVRHKNLPHVFDYGKTKRLDVQELRLVSCVLFHELVKGQPVLTYDAARAASLAQAGSLAYVTALNLCGVLLTRKAVLFEGNYGSSTFNGRLRLGPGLREYISQGPLGFLDPERLQKHWQSAAPQPASVAPPSAQELCAAIKKSVVGIDPIVRKFSARLSLHLQRARLIQANEDPGIPNQCVLLVGPSGTGKTFLASTALAITKTPLAIVDASELTSTGYVGLSVSDSVTQLVRVAQGIDRAKTGCLFYDEIDKKAKTTSEFGSRDVAGACVQTELLRLMEGGETPVGGRRASLLDEGTFCSKGVFFTFAGAFVGLEKLLQKQSRAAAGLGFGNAPTAAFSKSTDAHLYEALEEFGLIPEFLNRLTSVIMFPPPTIENLVQIAEGGIIPSYQKLLAAGGADLQFTPAAVRLMAACVLETKVYSRGIKSIVNGLIDEAVFESAKTIKIDEPEVRAYLDAAGQAAAV